MMMTVEMMTHVVRKRMMPDVVRRIATTADACMRADDDGTESGGRWAVAKSSTCKWTSTYKPT